MKIYLECWILILIVTIICASADRDREDCSSKGEVYKDCGIQPSCEATCKSRSPCQFHHTLCYRGCYCPKGHVRRNPPSDRKCIPEQQCPGRKGQKEEDNDRRRKGVKEEDSGRADRDRDRGKDRDRDRGKDRERDRGKDRGKDENRDRDRGKDENRDRDRGKDRDRDREGCSSKGEVYNDCGIQPSCEATCKSRSPCQFHHTLCYRGCYCPKGHVRRNPPSDRKCIPEHQCPGRKWGKEEDSGRDRKKKKPCRKHPPRCPSRKHPKNQG